ncbi:MAG: hypothetical protein ACI82A_002777 [Candidatus Azotimanducaceae bacterium]|jgi:hypothetical protein
MMKILPLSVIFFMTACAIEPDAPEVPEPTSFVALAKNAKAAGMKITAIDGEPIAETDGHYVVPGVHDFKVACQLDNGIGTTFSFEADLLPNHSYCFFSRDQGKSCTIIYTRVAWEGNGSLTCN